MRRQYAKALQMWSHIYLSMESFKKITHHYRCTHNFTRALRNHIDNYLHLCRQMLPKILSLSLWNIHRYFIQYSWNWKGLIIFKVHQFPFLWWPPRLTQQHMCDTKEGHAIISLMLCRGEVAWFTYAFSRWFYFYFRLDHDVLNYSSCPGYPATYMFMCDMKKDE
jgi:hypothetical protein